MKEKGLGAIIKTRSVMNFSFDMVCSAYQENLPEEYILPAGVITSIKNQFQYNSCVGFAISSALESMAKKYGIYEGLLSPWFIYGNSVNRPNYHGIGMFTEQAVNGVSKSGTVKDILFDNPEEMPDIEKKVKYRTDLIELAKQYAPGGFIDLKCNSVEDTEKTIKTALFKYGYYIVAASKKFFHGSHCFVIVGWNKKGNFILQNSWGEEWENKGRGEIPSRYIDLAFLFLKDRPEMDFKDVNNADWFYDDIRHGVFCGLVNGVSNDEFKPNDNIMRQDCAVIIERLCRKSADNINAFLETENGQGETFEKISFEPPKSKFNDIPNNEYFTNAVNFCYANGIIRGVGDGNFFPSSEMTRADMAAICVRTLCLIQYKIEIATGKKITLEKNDKIEFSDVKNKEWYYYLISYAAQYGLMNGDEDGRFRPNDSITRAEATAVFVRLFRCVDKILVLI